MEEGSIEMELACLSELKNEQEVKTRNANSKRKVSENSGNECRDEVDWFQVPNFLGGGSGGMASAKAISR